MHSFFDFISFMITVLQMGWLFIGAFLGVLFTLVLSPSIYQRHRRAMLRRGWRKDRPLPIQEGLSPEWGPYDPDVPSIGRRCICHGRKLHLGERVLMWPETGTAGLLHVAVYCETVKERL